MTRIETQAFILLACMRFSMGRKIPVIPPTEPIKPAKPILTLLRGGKE